MAGGAEGQAAAQFLATPDPARPPDEQRWWFYWARLTPDGAQVATTTRDPVWTGPMPIFPEFNEIAIDGAGRIHIAGVALAPHPDNVDVAVWKPQHFRQALGPPT